jgi:hypothetical protein
MLLNCFYPERSLTTVLAEDLRFWLDPPMRRTFSGLSEGIERQKWKVEARTRKHEEV